MRSPEEHLVVVAGGETLALPAVIVRECTLLPLLGAAAEPGIVGIALLRGEPFAVVHARRDAAQSAPTVRDVLVVVETSRGPVALLVEAVRGLRRLRGGRSLVLIDAAPVPVLDPETLWRAPRAATPARDAWLPATKAERLLLETRRRALAEAPAVPGRAVAYALVELCGERFAVDLAFVRAFVDVREVAEVPCAPPDVRGDVNVRGQIITLFDPSRALRLAGAAVPATRPKALVVESGDLRIGLLVDRILDILHADPDELVVDGGDALVRGALGKSAGAARVWDIDAMLHGGHLAAEAPA